MVPFTAAEDHHIIRLKEHTSLKWPGIQAAFAGLFPGNERNPGGLQVRYSRYLQRGKAARAAALAYGMSVLPRSDQHMLTSIQYHSKLLLPLLSPSPSRSLLLLLLQFLLLSWPQSQSQLQSPQRHQSPHNLLPKQLKQEAGPQPAAQLNQPLLPNRLKQEAEPQNAALHPPPPPPPHHPVARRK